MLAALFANGVVLTYAAAHIVRVDHSARAVGYLGVSAEQRAGDLIFRWDLLLPEQLPSGSIGYSPFTKNVSFRLVAHASDGRTTQEAIRILGSGPEGSTGSHNPGILTLRVVSN